MLSKPISLSAGAFFLKFHDRQTVFSALEYSPVEKKDYSLGPISVVSQFK
jgi:hypothetical protein